MIWDDKGYLLSKNKYSENSIISEVFTKDHGKITGIIFGGTSKKVKNYLQIGNQLYVKTIYKLESRFTLISIQKMIINLVILKLKYNRLYHHCILIIKRNYLV